MPAALLEEAARTVVLDQLAAKDMVVHHPASFAHVDQSRQRSIASASRSAEVLQRILRREAFAKILIGQAVTILLFHMLQVPQAVNHLRQVRLLVGFSVADVHRLQHMPAVWQTPALDGGQEMIDGPAAVLFVERHSVNARFPPGKVGRIVAIWLLRQHPRAFRRSFAVVFQRHRAVPGHGGRSFVGLLRAAVHQRAASDDQRASLLRRREEATGKAFVVAGRIIARAASFPP
jgi:hypothetical protein